MTAEIFSLEGRFMATAQAILGPLIWFGFIFNNLSLFVFMLHYLAVKLFLGNETICTPSQTFLALFCQACPENILRQLRNL